MSLKYRKPKSEEWCIQKESKIPNKSRAEQLRQHRKENEKRRKLIKKRVFQLHINTEHTIISFWTFSEYTVRIRTSPFEEGTATNLFAAKITDLPAVVIYLCSLLRSYSN